jgi:hypothetical protein
MLILYDNYMESISEPLYTCRLCPTVHHPVFGGVRVAHLLNVLCCVFVFSLSSSCVPIVSVLSIFDGPFGILVYLRLKSLWTVGHKRQV